MRTFLAAGILLAAVSFEALAGETHTYTVFRDGEPVGEQKVTFDRSESGLKVSVNWNVAVTIAGITFYRYEHERTEEWVDGSLTALEGRTHDDGIDFDVSYKCEGASCVWNVNGETLQFPSGVMPASTWNKNILGEQNLISPVDRDFYEVTVKSAGWQTVETGEGPIKAELVRVRGNIERDLWYDATDRLVRMRFEYADSAVELVLDDVSAVKTAQDRRDQNE